MNSRKLQVYSSKHKTGKGSDGKEFSFYEINCLIDNGPGRAPSVGNITRTEDLAPGAYLFDAIYMAEGKEKFFKQYATMQNFRPEVVAAAAAAAPVAAAAAPTSRLFGRN